ncbi:MAG: 6-carboxytetrahydropterin synthase [Pseudomonadota bacterium]
MKLFVDHLTVIDFAYLHPERGLLGESWIVDLELGGELDAQGMVFDFADVKRDIKACLDEVADHKLLVPLAAPSLDWASVDENLTWRFGQEQLRHRAPEEAYGAFEVDAITPEAMEPILCDAIRRVVPDSVDHIGLDLRLEPGIEARPHYQYVHGLKKHGGNCQRIAHGHRSAISVRTAGQPRPDLNRQIAERWRDIYLATREDITRHARGRVEMAYDSAQGYFELDMPEARIDIMEEDTTVEYIAAHLARTLREDGERDVEVRAWEGINKGALA